LIDEIAKNDPRMGNQVLQMNADWALNHHPKRFLELMESPQVNKTELFLKMLDLQHPLETQEMILRGFFAIGGPELLNKIEADFGKAPMALALSQGNHLLIRLLLEMGVEKPERFRSDLLKLRDPELLETAIEHGLEFPQEVLQDLCEDLIEEKNKAMLEFVLRKGVDSNGESAFSQPLLFLAINSNDPELMKIFLDSHPDLTKKREDVESGNDYTAIEYAEEHASPEIVQLIRERGQV
jgi:hypothetical protein